MQTQNERVFLPDYQEEYFDPPAFLNEETKRENTWNTNFADISRVHKERKLIAFTFDDAPGKTLESLLAVFSSFNEQNPDCPAYATLFCNGIRITNESKPLLQTALALGWELGNHTHSHPDLLRLSLEKAQAEIQSNERLLASIDHRNTHLFRAPFGNLNDAIKRTLSAPVINWSIDTLDWTNPAPERIISAVLEKKFSGAIVLMHDGYEATVSALKQLLPRLKQENYQVVSISQIIKAHGLNLKNGVEYVRAKPKK